MQPLPRLTLEAFRAKLEQCGCVWTEMGRFPDGTGEEVLYSIERGEGEDLKFSVIHVWNAELPIPIDTIRSVCTHLDLGPDIFDIAH